MILLINFKSKKMKKLFIAAMFATALFSSCTKDDEVVVTDQTLSGGAVSGVWAKGSTVTLNGHITIPEGKSLTIEEGVTVLLNDTTLGQEILVYGNLYCNGTSASPIKITVPEKFRRAGSFPRIWGGILCGPTAKELFVNYTIIEYTGYVTTEESPSVKAGFFKASAGEGLPAINFKNNSYIWSDHSIFLFIFHDLFIEFIA